MNISRRKLLETGGIAVAGLAAARVTAQAAPDTRNGAEPAAERRTFGKV